MSYDLTAREDDRYSRMITRVQASTLVASIADVRPNGASGFAFERGDQVWMEIDLELVTEEGDYIEPTAEQDPAEINCIRFHVPYGFIESLDACIDVASRIASGLGWCLHDEQTGEAAVGPVPTMPWWRFW